MEWVVILTLRPLYPRYPPNSGLGDFQSRSECFEEEKISSLWPVSNPDTSVLQFVALAALPSRTEFLNLCETAAQ